MSSSEPTTHAAWNEKNDADTAAESAAVGAFDADYYTKRAAILERHTVARAEREKRFSAWRAEQTAAMVADLGAKGGLYAACSAYGAAPRSDAARIAAAWTRLHATALEALNAPPHQWHLLFGLSGCDERMGYPSFFTCDVASRSCSKAERVAQRIVDGAGVLEIVAALQDLGATIEAELGAIPAHHVDARILARTDAARKAIAFRDVLNAVHAVDVRVEAALDARAFADPGVHVLTKIVRTRTAR